MAEMLVRLVDKYNLTDPHKDAQLTKRGDVIVVMPDGHPWSEAERAGDPWMIVKVPGVDPVDLSAFTAEELPDGTAKILQRRAFSLNIAALTHAPHLTLQQALALKVAKPPIPDPNAL